jgi:hypothetical protein
MSERLAANCRKIAKAMQPPGDLARMQRVDLVVTGDGQLNLDRAAGRLRRENLGVHDAASVVTTPTSVSLSANLETQLDDTSGAIELNALDVGDTTSVSLETILVGVINTIFAAVNFGGPGSSELAMRSDAILAGSATLDFPSIAAGAWSAALTITVTGAAAGDAHALGPPASLDDDLIPRSIVTAANTVSVWLYNSSAGPLNPTSATWKARVIK